jgi:hypothetical protein
VLTLALESPLIALKTEEGSGLGPVVPPAEISGNVTAHQ